MYQRSWQRFFEQEAPRYMDNVFTKNTAYEVEFLWQELGLSPGDRLLDVGCGTGRHAIALAGKGVEVTGVDISPDMLEVAKESARRAGVNVTFVHGDAASTCLESTFDHAICLCEGAFCLLEPQEEPLDYHRRILENVATMLPPGATFVLTVLNGYRFARSHSDADVASGSFNPWELSEIEEHQAADGSTFRTKEKGFTPPELTLLLQSAGFRVRSLWAGTAGSWSRRPPSLDEMELMVVAVRG